MGLARRNFENHERDKTVKIIQGFSFEFEDAKMMMAHLVPGMKTLDADHTFDDAASEKAILAWEVLQKSRMCTGTLTAARKNNERHNAWESRFLEIDEVPSGSNEKSIK